MSTPCFHCQSEQRPIGRWGLCPECEIGFLEASKKYLYDPYVHQASLQNSRAKHLGLPGRISPIHWLHLLAYYGWHCLACDRFVHLTVDHIIPLSKGGDNVISNAQPLCLRCNISKNDKTIDYRPSVPEWVKGEPLASATLASEDAGSDSPLAEIK